MAYRLALQETTRERMPRDRATTQTNLGVALAALGERESGTGRLEESVVAYRLSLQERTRERAPLDWASTQVNLASVLVMLVLGGLGRLYGAVLGVVIYMLVHNIAAKVDPYNWMFVIGAMLVGVVLFSRGGLLGLLDSARRWLARRA